jgi:ribosomal protein L37AE/L43A
MKVRLRVKIEFQGEKSEVLFAKIKQKKKVNNQLKKKQKCPLCGSDIMRSAQPDRVGVD